MILNKKKFQMNSETLLPFIMERTNKMLVITDYDNMFQVNYVNDCKFLKKLGYKYTELVGTSFLSLFNPDNVSKINDLLKNKSHTPSQLHEIRMRAKNGDIYWVEMAIDEFVTEDRENKKLISLTDISKQKELESQLEEFKKRFEKTSNTNLKIKYKDLSTSRKIDQTLHNPYEIFKNIIENIPQHIFWKDHNLAYLGCNQNYAKLIGQSSPECIIGQADCELLWDKKLIYMNNEKEFNVINSKNAEYHVIESWTTEDGRKTLFDVNRIPLFDSNGKVVVILVTYNDITEAQRMGVALRESEARLRAAIESLPFEVFMVDKNGRYIMQNTTCKNNWGDVIGKRPEEATDDEGAIKIWKGNHSRAFSGETVRGEVNYQIDGDTRFFYNITSPIYIENEVQNIIGVYIDITELKALAQKGRESEETFRTITEQSFMGIVIIQDGIFKYFNEQTGILNGYSNEEIKSWGPYEFSKLFHPEDKDFVIDQAKKKEIGVQNVVEQHKYRIITKTGEIRWIENFSKTINYEGRPADLVMSVDVTNNLSAEEKLKDSEEKYRSLFNNMNAGFAYHKVIVDNDNNPVDYQYIEANPAFEKLTGLNASELIGKNVTEILPGTENDPADWIGKFGKVGLTGIPLVVEDYSEAIDKWYKVSGYSPKKGYFAVTFTDITDRKKAEEKLITSEKKYRMLFENSPIALMDQDFSEMKRYVDSLKASGVDDFDKYFDDYPNEILKCLTKIKIIDVNTKTLEIYKAKSKKDFIMRISQISEDIEQLITEEMFLDNKKEMLSLIRGETNYESEIVTKTFTGDTIYLYFKTSIVPVFENTWSKIIVSIIDITDRKLTEQKLKESEEKYHQLFETSPDGVILTDSEGNIIECNSALESITGYPLTEYINKNFLNLEMSDQNVKDHILECFNHLSNNNKLGFVEFPFIHKNKKLRWVQITGSHISIKAQTRLLFVLHDITSQKNAEKALKKSRAQYRDLLETSSVGVMEIDIIKNQINYVNPKLLEITGYRKEELSNDSLLEKLINPKDLPKLIESNEEMDLEFRIKDKNGKLKWVSGRRLPHFDEFGNLISTRLWLDDITEKKIYEELIYELNVNFLNFTADIQNNINLLLKTGLKLLDGDLILYAHRIKTNDQDLYYIITSDNDSYTYDYKELSENLVINELFNEGHDFPQSIIGIDKEKYIYTDPFVKKTQAKGCFGKIIRSQDEMEDIICVFFKRNPIINGQDKLVLFLISDAIEIEQRRWQVQQDLEEQNTTLNKINKLKTELFSRTSHELKTPLISIKGFTELLLTLHKSKLDPETISILKEIKDGSKRLEKIINLLLESAKLEAGQLELKKSKEDLTFLINFCVKELKGLTTLRNQSVFFDSNNIIKAFLDKERIYEVVSNLLLNAVKYTPPGGIISIKIYTENNDHIVSITDNGIGFTEEEKKQVFKQFGKIERYGQGWDVAIEGTGLGLYITKKLVELHGGKIWLESEGRDKGTTFNFSIPMNI